MSTYQTFEPLFDADSCKIPDQVSLDGKFLRDQGIKQVSEHNENWMDEALDFAAWLVPNTNAPDFTGEDLRLAISSSAIRSPRHPNAWGALINTLIKRKIIVPTGEYRSMKDSSSHARKTPVYKAT